MITGIAWLSLVRVVKCQIKFVNEQNPEFLFIIINNKNCTTLEEWIIRVKTNLHDPNESGYRCVTKMLYKMMQI